MPTYLLDRIPAVSPTVCMGRWSLTGPQVHQRRTISLGTGLSCLADRFVLPESISGLVPLVGSLTPVGGVPSQSNFGG